MALLPLLEKEREKHSGSGGEDGRLLSGKAADAGPRAVINGNMKGGRQENGGELKDCVLRLDELPKERNPVWKDMNNPVHGGRARLDLLS